MCGIAGIWVAGPRPLETAASSLGRMLGCIAHRGPDDEGAWADHDAGVFLGHRRLAVIDPSPLGRQPMVSADGRLVIVFNGEIYNFHDVRRDLVARGVQFTSNSDTEVLLYGYREWGEAVVDRLVGMYAFAIWDSTAQELFLARDRAGEKPLYYASAAWGFAFASEVSALAELPDIADEIDQAALSLYFQFQYVPAPHSIYKRIRKLPPAHTMRVKGGTIQGVRRYWDPVPVAVGPRLAIDEPEAIAELESLLRRAITGQMIADVPLGAFLSGGFDSTAVVSFMVDVSSVPVRTFTIGFDVPEFDESKHAGAVAKHLGTDHTVEYLTERDALELIPQVPFMYGEPFADSSALPTHLVSRTARRHVTVSLSGDGGDEAFGGYRRFSDLVLLARVAGPNALLGRALQPFVSLLPGKVGRGGELLSLPPKEIFRRLSTGFAPTYVRALTGFVQEFDEYDRAWSSSSHLELRQRAMLTDMLTYLPEAILVKVDRAAMATSLETRAPLLDHRVLEFAFQLPPHLLLRKRLLKEIVYRRVPHAIMDRPKQGFGVPLSRWFRGKLRPLIYDTLTQPRLEAAGVQNYPVVSRMIDEHMSRKRDHSARLWTLLVLAMWNDTRRKPSRSVAPSRVPALASLE